MSTRGRIAAVAAIVIGFTVWGLTLAVGGPQCPAGGTYAGHGVCLGPAVQWERGQR